MFINLKCNNCKESFKVEDKYFIEKNQQPCPNCGIELPNTVLGNLQRAVSLITQCRQALIKPRIEGLVSSRDSYSWDISFSE